MCPDSGLRTAPNWPKIRKMTNNVTIFRHDVIVNFFWRCFVPLIKFSSGSSFMLISSLVLELWQFYFIEDWKEIRKWEIPPSGFCPISGDWDKLWILNLARMSLIEYYWLLQNARGYSFYHFWYIKGKPTEGVKLPPPLPPLTQNRVKSDWENKKYSKCLKLCLII